MNADDLPSAWDSALGRYRDVDASAAQFNVGLLEALRPRWGQVVRPDTSMFELLFTRPGSTGYAFDERVEVLVETDQKVRLALVRQVPRPGEEAPSGPVVVSGDFVRPDNALAAVEAFLLQLADPEAR